MIGWEASLKYLTLDGQLLSFCYLYVYEIFYSEEKLCLGLKPGPFSSCGQGRREKTLSMLS